MLVHEGLYTQLCIRFAYEDFFNAELSQSHELQVSVQFIQHLAFSAP